MSGEEVRLRIGVSYGDGRAPTVVWPRSNASVESTAEVAYGAGRGCPACKATSADRWRACVAVQDPRPVRPGLRGPRGGDDVVDLRVGHAAGSWLDRNPYSEDSLCTPGPRGVELEHRAPRPTKARRRPRSVTWRSPAACARAGPTVEEDAIGHPRSDPPGEPLVLMGDASRSGR